MGRPRRERWPGDPRPRADKRGRGATEHGGEGRLRPTCACSGEEGGLRGGD